MKLIPRLGISAVFGLASSFGHCQSPSQQPDGATPKGRQAIILQRLDGAAVSAMPAPLNVPPSPVIAVMSGGMSPLEAGTAAVFGAPYSGIRTTTILNGDKIVLRHTTRSAANRPGQRRTAR